MSIPAILAVFHVVALAAGRSCSLNEDGSAAETQVLILGAGITGITAARTLEVNGTVAR